MKSLVVKRFVAFSIDYFIIVVYALALFGISVLFDLQNSASGPFSGQLIGFTTLTLPVLLYFILSESSKRKGSFGKYFVRLSVQEAGNSKPNIILRNILKLLPWEIAHTGVHWIIFYAKLDIEPPFWVWIVLILPQILMLIFLLSIVITKGESSIYDRLSKSKVKLLNPS